MQRFTIVGAGIVGSCVAMNLKALRPDANIVLIDKSLHRYDNASCGNMGGFATCEVRPLATLKNVFRGVSWMLDPLAAFTLRPRSIPSLAPWLGRFLRSAITPGHTEHVISAQQALMSRAHAAHLELLKDSGLERLISSNGTLVLYKSERRMDDDWNARWHLFRDQGEECTLLTKSDLRERLTSLNPSIEHGISVPGIKFWKSPAELLRGLHEQLRRRGVQFICDEVMRIDRNDNVAEHLLLASGETHFFDHLTIAAGAWSGALCADVGDSVPLDSERGYATTIRLSDCDIQNLLLFPDDEFVATPMNEGLRLGGTVELADFDTAPNYQRADILESAFRDYFPSIDTSNREQWMGNRPSSPDGLPIIGNSPSCHNVTYAFGHGHVGMTQAAITGRLSAQMIIDETPEIDVAPYSIARFS
ncbi:MAG: FAD-binding oxidoreductase [Gammaproteobacteria bacterium]|nr:FAD-binding oxidoreductase [Gammaproteobacteria bacterium]